MKALTKTTRLNSALQVIENMNNGMTVVEACQAVGMPRSSFYYIMENNPEAFAEIQAMIEANNREQLGLILMGRTEMLRKIIEDGLSDNTKPRDRLAIFMKLTELMGKMTQQQHVMDEDEQRALEFLKRGPKLVQAKSCFATETTVTVRHEVEVGQSRTE